MRYCDGDHNSAASTRNPYSIELEFRRMEIGRCVLPGPHATALPAGGELAFEIFIAGRTVPVFMGIRARGIALQILAQQIIGAREFAILNHPHFA